MEKQELKHRSEVPVELTWDLDVLFASREEYDTALKTMQADVATFAETYAGKLADESTIIESIQAYEAIMTQISVLYHYASLPAATDLTNADNTQISRQFDNVMADVSAALSFYDSELTQVEEVTLDAVAMKEPRYASFVRHTKANKHIQLNPEVEKALAQLSATLSAPEGIYDQAKLADMDFGTFTVDGEEYPLSFVLYEDFYMYHTDTKIRRAAFDAFSKVLKKYENVIAQTYYTKLQTEKTLATMRGFDSIFDYLLYDQEVDQSLYNRQIDVIMSDLAPVMRKYITHLKEVQGLDKVTYADLKIDLDPEYSPKVTIEDSKKMVEESISVLGKEYTEMIMRAYPERWVDFAQNTGKSTGGFCTTVSANKAHPYILMSWTNHLSNVYTLIHEFGHAGQGIMASENNAVVGDSPSLYLIEGPSTFNELLLTDSLTRNTDDARMERFALTKMMSDTYFHNFVTHLLEAAYQREVYKLIDAGMGFDAQKLSELKRSVLEQFWGDAVEINAGAELTWMRQPHYYMGLYPYTYSAGLTIATQAFLKVKEEGQPAVDRWLEFLKTGDTYIPVDAAAIAGVDITTDKPLKDTIAYLDRSVNRMIELTKEIK
ncbi:oligoendopeptidase F [Jeotgalibaca sp. A127]|uniref:oligoendopeptidase F n=1 Tax=Jeotgalibaca sp. A127 TaxID=3457324 RepID=UPI003FD38455